MPEHIDHETGEILAEPPRTPMVQPQMRPLASANVSEVCSALAAAQGEMEAPLRSKKGQIAGTSRTGRDYSYEYAYAPLEEIIRVVREPFAKHGLGRQQYIVTRSNMWFLRTILWHTSGQWLSSDYPIFPEAETGQKFAAAVTYAKRQGLCLVAGIAPEDDFDGGDADAVRPSHRPADARKARGAVRDQPQPEPSPAPAAADGNGSPIPVGFQQFFERESYEIDGAKLGGWPRCAAQWETQFFRVVEHIGSRGQLAKLKTDNGAQEAEFARAVKPEIYQKFLNKLDEFEKRLEPIEFAP